MAITGRYGKKSYRKRAGRPRAKRPYAKRSSAIAKVVKKVLSRNLERKSFMLSQANNAIRTATASQAPFVVDLVPQVLQGTGVSQRIGNEIKISKAYIKGFVNLRPTNLQDNPLGTPVYVKMFLLSYKITNQPNFTFASLYNNFFQSNNSSVTWQQNMLDIILEVNKEVWTVHKTKVFKLGGTSTTTSLVGLEAGATYFDNSQMSRPFYFDITKHLDKLKYDDTVNNLCTNRNLLLLCQSSYADGSTSTYIPAECHYQKVWHYTDA